MPVQTEMEREWNNTSCLMPIQTEMEQNGMRHSRTPLELTVQTRLVGTHYFVHLESCSNKNPPNSNQTQRLGFPTNI
jgi:hypothetical protein